VTRIEGVRLSFLEFLCPGISDERADGRWGKFTPFKRKSIVAAPYYPSPDRQLNLAFKRRCLYLHFNVP
jgi:hypothetical protein